MSFYKLTKFGYTLYSPDGSIAVNLFCEKGTISYEVRNGKKIRYKKSPLGVTIGKTEDSPVDYSYGNEIVEVEDTAVSDREFTVLGRAEKRTETSIRYIVTIRNGTTDYQLHFTVFNNGVAFRYVFPEIAGLYVFGESTEFGLSKRSKVYASFGCRHPGCNTKLNGRDTLCYECTYDEYDPSKKFRASDYEIEHDWLNFRGQKYDRFFDYLLTPMTVRFKDGTYGAILESDVVNYYGSNLRPLGAYRFGLNTLHGGGRFETFKVEKAVKTPMRVLLLEKDLDGLYNNGIVNAVVERADGDFSFVKAGKSTWHWHVESVRNHRITYEMLKKYTLAAIKMGFEYNIIDAGWRRLTKTEDGKTYGAKELIGTLCKVSDSFGVKQILWAGYINNELNPESFDEKGECSYSTREFIDSLCEYGAAGAKIDFFRGEHHMAGGVNMYEKILEYGKDKKLVFNFHGATKPTGQSAKYPNELSREGIKGMENYVYSPSSYPDIARAFCTLTFVRGLAGHGDWTPFVQDGIGLATVILTDSPLNAISATAEDLLDHPAREFIKSIPTTFEKTHILSESEFGKFISVVKEADGAYFFAGINNTGKTFHQKVEFERFLPKNTSWQVELWFDTPSGLKSENRTIGELDVLEIVIPDCRGYAMRVSRLDLNYYGGEVTGDVEFYIRDGEEVYYTLDDTDPCTSDTRIKYGGAFKIERSCYLTACLLKDEEKIAGLRHRFNVLPPEDIFGF